MKGAGLLMVLPRGFLPAVGVIGMLWGGWRLADLAALGAVPAVATGLAAAQPYRPGDLEALMPELAAIEARSRCAPEALRAAALIRTRLAETALAQGDARLFPARLTRARETTRAAIACAPTDAMLWLSLFWLENNTAGFGEKSQQYLRLSYRNGPNEGWIAIRRAPMALAVFDSLPGDLRAAVKAEFAGLVRSELHSFAADILAGPGWAHRGELLAALASVDVLARRRFADMLATRGIEAAVPGVPTPVPLSARR